MATTKTHHGKALQKLVDEDPRSIQELCKIMKCSRQSLYRWMGLEKWTSRDYAIKRCIERAGFNYDAIIGNKVTGEIKLGDVNFTKKLMDKVNELEAQLEERENDLREMNKKLNFLLEESQELTLAVWGIRGRPVKMMGAKPPKVKMTG